MRNTKQREEVLKAVLNSSDHPDAQSVYLKVKENLPNISLGTVYRNLCQLACLNLIRQVRVSDGADRYDKTLKRHSHFHCNVCGDVSDIEIDLEAMDICRIAAESTGNRIDGLDLMFSGICESCRQKSGADT